jgi:1,4-dihydroxy-6-naphthoate synthase
VRIRLGHSADPDDAFMAWPLAAGRIDTRGLDIELVPEDIQRLNEWATEGRLEVTAASMHAYARLRDRYDLLPVGASFGLGYGPVVVAPQPLSREELRRTEIVVPGTLTTAYLVLRQALGGDFPHRSLPFDRILEEVADGRARAGLVLHEGQLTYPDHGLVSCLDLGRWWQEEKALPLPLGVVLVRRDLRGPAAADVEAVFREALEHALAHRDEALDYALGFARGLDRERADRFVSMYVNELTLELGADGRAAVSEILALVGHDD